jgi:mRNA interferase RelE/StbE
MRQLNFSDQSLAEINKLEIGDQLHLIEQISVLCDKVFKDRDANLPKIQRGKTSFFRIKVDSFRVYLEPRDGEQLFCHYILPQHTLSDFVFRSKLPISEEQMIEQHSSFWKYVDSLKKNNLNAR